MNCGRPQPNPGRHLTQRPLPYRQEEANGPCSSSSKQQGLPTAANGTALTLGRESAQESSPQATAQDRLCPKSARHRPQPARDRQQWSRQTLLSPSSLPKSQGETSSGLPSSVCPQIHQLECPKLYTSITCSIHVPLLAKPSCLAQREVPGPGQPQGRAVPCSAVVPNHQQTGLLYVLSSCSSWRQAHNSTPVYFQSAEVSGRICLDKTRLGYQLDPGESLTEIPTLTMCKVIQVQEAAQQSPCRCQQRALGLLSTHRASLSERPPREDGNTPGPRRALLQLPG